MATSRILAVVTNQATYGANPHRTGLWTREAGLADPGVEVEVDLVGPAGGGCRWIRAAPDGPPRSAMVPADC